MTALGPEPLDLPPMLAARPRDARRGLPIPPVNVHPDPSGGGSHVDFTTINTTVATQLALDRRCSLCGEPMDYWVAFVGTPRTVELLRFTDPPGHPECMTAAALTLCPHLAIERHRRAHSDRPGAGVMPAGSHGDKPAGWTLGITRTYRTLFIPEQGFTVYLPAPFRTVRAYVYGPDGRLQPGPGIR
ncbi:hypothetical protein [Phytohabitans houttuyneae]|uniref:Uncharacterized protein n=1 Tax=Phytohabitans houttuyneae TaxID=1076126 RepID=A0A6V8KNI9_9ACTN|nr:hypothetical protein [Phytohabitans houttuyneae]GFJ84960.1 hypothetical protein Phou_091400 [Phytohabitans houttuyneae]